MKIIVFVVLVILLFKACERSYTYEYNKFNSFLNKGQNRYRFSQFKRFLVKHRLWEVIPAQQLFRQGSDWNNVGLPCYKIPPIAKWKNILPLLIFIKKELIPQIGSVEIVSCFRTPRYNRAAGGSRGSKHLYFNAADIIPLKQISTSRLKKILKNIWRKIGRQYHLGLGLYSGLRFHIDTMGFRKWGW